MDLDLAIEALVFASDRSISLKEIEEVMSGFLPESTDADSVTAALGRISEKYERSGTIIRLVHSGGGYQFLTDPEFYPVVQQLNIHRSKKKLSQAALETLAIVAYRQPVTKLEIEQIRGVNCDYTVQKLLEKELIVINGKADSVGKPVLYGTSSLFMDYFGINSVAELPQMKDLATAQNEIGNEPQ